MLEGYCEVNNEEYLAHFLLFILLKFVVQEANKIYEWNGKKFDHHLMLTYFPYLLLISPVTDISCSSSN
jgi:hypothetical protein